jgi:hypothetical protein
MSGPVGPGPFPPDQPHSPVDLRRDGHMIPSLAVRIPTAAASRKLRRYTLGCNAWKVNAIRSGLCSPCLTGLAAAVYLRGERADEGQVPVTLSVVKTIANHEFVPDIEARIGHVYLHLGRSRFAQHGTDGQ